MSGHKQPVHHRNGRFVCSSWDVIGLAIESSPLSGEVFEEQISFKLVKIKLEKSRKMYWRSEMTKITPESEEGQRLGLAPAVNLWCNQKQSLSIGPY
jgi:hypothetical protein